MAKERRFRGKIEGSEKGRVFILLPFDPAEQSGPRGCYYVTGTINGLKFRARLDQSARGYFVPLGPAKRRDCGFHVGDAVEVVVRDESPPREGLAPDIVKALEADPEAGEFFDALAGFYRKAYLRWIDATKRSPEIRAARISELVELMRDRRKMRPR